MIILAINQTGNLLILTYLIFIFGLDKFGDFSVGLIYSQISIILIEWGFQTHATENLKSKSKFEPFQYFINATLIKIAFFFAVILIFIFFSKLKILNLASEKIFPLSLLVLFGSLNPLWFLNLFKKTKLLIYPTLIGKCIYGLIVLFYFNPSTNIVFVYYLIAFQFFLNFFIGYYFVFKLFFEKYTYQNIELFNLIKNSFTYFLSSIVNHNITSIWGVYVVYACTSSHIGIFVYCEQIYRGMCLISNLITNSLRIELISKNLDSIKKIILKLLLIFYCCTSFLLVIIAYMTIENLNENYFWVIVFFVISWICFSTSKLVSVPLLGSIVDMKKINYYVLAYGVLNILLIFICYLLNLSDLNYIVFMIMIATSFDCIYYLRKTNILLKK